MQMKIWSNAVVAAIAAEASAAAWGPVQCLLEPGGWKEKLAWHQSQSIERCTTSLSLSSAQHPRQAAVRISNVLIRCTSAVPLRVPPADPFTRQRADSLSHRHHHHHHDTKRSSEASRRFDRPPERSILRQLQGLGHCDTRVCHGRSGQSRW